MRAAFLSTVMAVLALAGQGAFALRYLAQAALGQARIVAGTRPIADAAADPAIDPHVRRLLASVPDIKAFGRSQGLEPTGSYDRFADLRRSAAAWVVQACAPLSFQVKHWRFPVVGSVPYLGFFDQEEAAAYARSLAGDGALDVDVRPVSAFSTLGWLRDPVLSTMIGPGPEALGALGNVVLHESVHATVYVKDQSPFDESLASFVADRLTVAWLEGSVGRDAPEARAWIEGHARERARVARLHAAWAELDAVYRSARDDAWKRAEKARILRGAADDLQLASPPNNAVLAGYRTYDTGAAAFDRLLAACGGSWPRLLRAVRTLSPRDFAGPHTAEVESTVDRLTRGGCRG